MDIFDQAQANDELFRQAALNRHYAGRQNPVPTPTLPLKGRGSRCMDCGGEIEPERLKALPYAVRCVGCQTKKERRERHGLV